MGRVTDRLNELGLALPLPQVFPNPNRTGAVQVGELLFVLRPTHSSLNSRQVPSRNLFIGSVPKHRSKKSSSLIPHSKFPLLI